MDFRKFHRKFQIISLFLFFVQPISAVSAVDQAVVGSILLRGNKVTRPAIILRELEFRPDDTIRLSAVDEMIARSERNLRNLPLFHFVTISYRLSDRPGLIDFEVDLTERWYTWVWPVFELSDRNFNSWMRNGDLTRLSYGLFLQRENFRGRLEKLHLKIKLGYQQEAMLLYEIPYINKQKTMGAGFQLSLSRQRETGYFTDQDKLLFYRSDDFLLRSANLVVYMRYRPDIHFTHTIQLRYNTLSASDSLLKLNSEYTPEGNPDPAFLEASYLLKADFRDQRHYPLHGWYAEAFIARTGLLPDDDFDFFSSKIILRAYHRFDRNWHLAASFTSRLMTRTNLPYPMSQALGYYRDYVRGYEYRVVDGNNFWLGKLNLKYALLKPSVVKLSWPETTKFNTIPCSLYLGAFVDAGRVWPKGNYHNNRLPEKQLIGAGVGLDFITYYDKVVRMEYSVNGLGESGFFLHFMAAI